MMFVGTKKSNCKSNKDIISNFKVKTNVVITNALYSSEIISNLKIKQHP